MAVIFIYWSIRVVAREPPRNNVETSSIKQNIFELWHEISNNLTSVDSDEPGDEPLQPPVKLRNYKWCSGSSLTIIEYSSD